MSMLLYKRNPRIRSQHYQRDPGMTKRDVFILLACIALFCVFVKFGSEYLGSTGAQYTVGLNGTVEQRCIGGMQYTVDGTGRATQVLSEFGKGLPCR